MHTHLAKPDGFRVSLVSPPAKWSYLMNVDSIIMSEQTAFHNTLVVAHDLFTLQELLETVVGKVLHRLQIVDTVPKY